MNTRVKDFVEAVKAIIGFASIIASYHNECDGSCVNGSVEVQTIISKDLVAELRLTSDILTEHKTVRILMYPDQVAFERGKKLVGPMSDLKAIEWLAKEGLWSITEFEAPQ